MSNIAQIQSLLGADADPLLNHKAKVSRDVIHVPSPTIVDSAFGPSDRSPQVMRSLQTQTRPYLGGRLYLAPPLKRYPRQKTDFLGFALRDIPIEPWLVGQTLYFQVWYEDPGSTYGAALSDALRVFVYP